MKHFKLISKGKYLAIRQKLHKLKLFARANKKIVVHVWCTMKESGYTISVRVNKLAERKILVDSRKIKSADVKDKFFTSVFDSFPRCCDEGNS